MVEIGAAVVELLLQLLQKGDECSAAIVRALGEIADVRSVESLLRALDGFDDGTRSAAARALGAISDPRALEPLGARLKDKNDDVRDAAADALARFGEPGAQYLVRALDTDAWLAASALAKAGDGRAVRTLIKAANGHVTRRIEGCSYVVDAELAADLLLTLLQASVQRVALDDLRAVMTLDDNVIAVRYEQDTGGLQGNIRMERVEAKIDCQPIKQIAAQELIRRGL